LAENHKEFMTDANEVGQIVERVVTQVLQGHLGQIREELVRRVLEELPQGAMDGAAQDGASGAGPADLLRGVAAIHAGGTQKEILRALLDSVAQHVGRTALFVIKGGTASGWQGRGFDDNDAVKDFALDTTRGLPERVLHEKAPFSGQILDMDPRFIDRFGGPADDHIVMLPLLLKDKVAALLYVDCGLDKDRLDTASVELLVVSTSAWLELVSLRKQAPRDAVPYSDSVPAAPAMQAAPSFNDPFAGHAPRHTAAAASAPAYEAPAVEPAHAEVVSVAAAAAGVDHAGPAGGHAGAALSEEDADVHRKAQRFARLLVDEIKLYNQAKVAEGRKNKDLYDRLKEDIDKSRATFKKRYGNTVAASVDYLQAEVVRSLAEDDISVMGPNFRR
jgi:hypothetical protein